MRKLFREYAGILITLVIVLVIAFFFLAGVSGCSAEPANASKVETAGYIAPEGKVYVASSGDGTKYHRTSTCSNMKDPDLITKKVAIAAGYDACSKCY